MGGRLINLHTNEYGTLGWREVQELNTMLDPYPAQDRTEIIRMNIK